MTNPGRRLVPAALLALILSTVSLSGCVGAAGPRAQVGAVTGAVGGGLIGAAAGGGAGGVLSGVLLGGLVGGAIGDSLDRADRELASRAAWSSLEYSPSGSTSEWANPDSGHSGSTTPLHTYQVASGSYCREFTQMIHVGGHAERGYGTACLQPYGIWAIVQ